MTSAIQNTCITKESILYEVHAHITNKEIEREWISWMLETHIDDVVKAGASIGHLVKDDSTSGSYRAIYWFSSRRAFEKYIEEKAPQLRAEGIRRFGDSNYIQYSRTTAELLGS